MVDDYRNGSVDHYIIDTDLRLVHPGVRTHRSIDYEVSISNTHGSDIRIHTVDSGRRTVKSIIAPIRYHPVLCDEFDVNIHGH